MLYEDPKNNLEEELEYYRMIGIYDVTDGDDYEDYRDYWNEMLDNELKGKEGAENGIDTLESYGR